MANRKELLTDLKNIAAKLGHSPTADEYAKYGTHSERQIRKHFGGHSAAIAAAGLVPKEVPSVADEPGLRIAKQAEEIKALRREIVDLEDGVLTGERIKRLIGADGVDTLGQGADWLRGSKMQTRGRVNGIPTLFLSDLHLDEVVKKEQVRGYNEYNRAIAEKRLEYTFKQAVNLLKNHLVNPKFEGMVLPFGGDFVSGTIHEELSETNEAVINKTMIHWCDRIVDGILMLADEFGKLFIPCVVGNHGRHHKKPRFKNQVIDNYEWLMYHIMARALKNDSRISFLIPEAPDAFYEVYGMRVCLTHGNQFQGGQGIGGIMVPILRGIGKKQSREAALDSHFQLTIMGHWHQYIHTRNLVINGSMKGYCDYAFGNNFPYERPTQALWIHHRDRGVIFPMAVLSDGYEACKENKQPALSW